jgi:hypothetical protein
MVLPTLGKRLDVLGQELSPVARDWNVGHAGKPFTKSGSFKGIGSLD